MLATQRSQAEGRGLTIQPEISPLLPKPPLLFPDILVLGVLG